MGNAESGGHHALQQDHNALPEEAELADAFGEIL